MLFTLLLSLAIAQDDEAIDGHDHVVIVLDGSGSMKDKLPNGQTRMAAAKEALHSVVHTMDSDTYVGILAFGKVVDHGDGFVYPLGPRDVARLDKAIDAVTPSGNTPLGRYMKIGADALLKARAESHNYGTYKLLVVTDGEASDSKALGRFSPEIVDRGITLDVIGVAMKKSHTLKSLANSYRAADDKEQLVKAVKEVFAEIDTSHDDALQSEVFEVIDGLPDAFAMAAIEALSTASFGNQPIGEKPKPKPRPKGLPVPPDPVPHNPNPTPQSGCSTVPSLSLAFVAILPLFRRRS